VLFLVDRTVARVPSTPPQFHMHYNRFLGATYGNKVSRDSRSAHSSSCSCKGVCTAESLL
jgi:hypothetical protein